MADLNGVAPALRERIEWIIAAAIPTRRGQMFWVTCGFRTLAEQWDLWNKYQAYLNAKTQHPRDWQKYAAFAATAAYPGTSMHGKTDSHGNPNALAVDLGCDPVDHPLRASLARQASLLVPIAGEPWHMQLAPVLKPLPGIVTPPQPFTPPIQRPPVITTLGDTVRRIDIHVPSLDEAGNGWVEVDGRYDKIVGGILPHGSFPPVDGYGRIPRFAAQDRGGKTIVEITDGLPHQELFFGICFSE